MNTFDHFFISEISSLKVRQSQQNDWLEILSEKMDRVIELLEKCSSSKANNGKYEKILSDLSESSKRLSQLDSRIKYIEKILDEYSFD